MRLFRSNVVAVFFLLLGCAFGPQIVATAAEFSIHRELSGDVAIHIDGELFTRYVTSDKVTNKCYFWPIIGPNGEKMTRDYPMKDVEGEKKDHPHHRSVCFGMQNAGGFNTWHEAMTFTKNGKVDEKKLATCGFQKHTQILKEEASGNSATLVVRCDNVTATGEIYLRQKRTANFHVAENGSRVMDLEIVFTGVKDSLKIVGKKDSGLSVRVAHSMCVEAGQGGRIVNSEGHKDKDAWGKRVSWVDFNGPVNGKKMGVAVLNHPESFRYPNPWHVRNYGLFTANPFALKEVGGEDESGDFELAKGTSFTLKYRIIFHEGDEQQANIAKAWGDYTKDFVSPVVPANDKPQELKKAASADSKRLPNIIYIMTDDLGYGDLGCYGQKVVQTPNLDRMASEGMRFTDHYSGHTVCRPSRLVLWSGQHVGHTGLNGNRARSLTGMESTVAQRLKAVGYKTGGVGKWALGHVNDPSEIENAGHPNNNGFDYWFGYMNQSNAHNYYPPYLWENKSQVVLAGNVLMEDPAARGRVSKKRVTYSHDMMTDAALKFVRDNKDDPFLLHIHWTIPHANNEGGRVLKDGMEVPDYGQYAEKDWPNPEKGFAAMVSRMDSDVGKLFALLDELGLDDDTLVLFTSDNGPHEEGNHKHEYFDSNGPLKGYKRSMHEGGIRVPLIARWPGKVAAGSESDLPSAFWDFLPTACEIAGVEVDGLVDGISYLPTLTGNAKAQKEHEYLYWTSSEGATAVGVRQGDWKLVKYRKPKRKKGEDAGVQADEDWRLYDLSQDIGEDRDLSEKHPDKVAKLIAVLKRDELPTTVASRR